MSCSRPTFRQIELLRCTFRRTSRSGTESYTHRGEEAGIVVSGIAAFCSAVDEQIILNGDSFALFPSDVPQQVREPHRSGLGRHSGRSRPVLPTPRHAKAGARRARPRRSPWTRSWSTRSARPSRIAASTNPKKWLQDAAAALPRRSRQREAAMRFRR